ncbi:Aste57867_8733 [Aphanomyces stellatus]|uniref:Aste57867_8733 protein n=1 Tax=Aphanomyces stellatus TaxID=120398 RepID=A0A485KL84_9STRA|nr:hypothetical protein As57867_008699 [Aphanomyces stellatus]VFT85619.1 Aste57867_8733 [Aphanomyces stellatus]
MSQSARPPSHERTHITHRHYSIDLPMLHKGVLHSLAANAAWGFAPIYWKQLATVPTIEVLGHRLVWSFLLLVALLLAQSEWTAFRGAAFTRRTLAIYTLSGLLMGVNLFLSVWAVVSGYIVEMSLGYFISPLINVLLGVVVLRETLRRWQILSIALACAGVLVVAIAYGKFPWLALTLSTTFGLYGLVKKKAPLPSLHGITLELGIFFIPALIYLVVIQANGTAHFLHADWSIDLYLVASCVVTIAPLIFYSSAAKLISLTLLGVIQYTAPSLQFLVGVFGYHEHFSIFKLVGFICVWTGLIVFTVESMYQNNRIKLPDDTRLAIETPRDDVELGEISTTNYDDARDANNKP